MQGMLLNSLQCLAMNHTMFLIVEMAFTHVCIKLQIALHTLKKVQTPTQAVCAIKQQLAQEVRGRKQSTHMLNLTVA